MAYIFMDESGDLGFDFRKKKTSKYFVIAFLFIGNKRPVEKIVKKVFQSFSKQQKKHHPGTLHCNKERPVTRLKVLKTLNEKNVSVISIYLNKAKVYTRLKDEKQVLYNYVTNILLDRVYTKKLIPLDQPIHLIASRRETNKFFNENFKSYLKIQIFYSALNDSGRAGFVMANSAADARSKELEIRKKMIENGTVDVMVSVGSNFFYTVTLPCTLWFLDRGKKKTDRSDKVLFLDARQIYNQIDRAHRDFTPEQIEFLANIVRLYRKENLNSYTFNPDGLNLTESQINTLKSAFSKQKYADVPGLCKTATIKEIEAQGWSLNPGRYVGVAERAADDFDFKEKLEELNEELEKLNAEARELEERISENVTKLLEV
jgi:prefoldin subunit 5